MTMQAHRKWGRLGAVLPVGMAMALLASGCGGSGKAAQDRQEPSAADALPTEKRDPVTITVGINASQMTEQEVRRFISEPVRKKYPYITVEPVSLVGQGQTLTDRAAAKMVPDIVANGVGNIVQEYVPLGLMYDMSGLIEKYGFAVNRIQPILLDAIRIGSGIKETFGIPIWNQAFGLIYNKDLFDKFGAAYPNDGMTWEQVRDLAIKLNRNENGVQYYGLFPDSVYRGANQLGLRFIDWSTKKAVLETDEWKELFTYWYSLWSAPGYAPKGTNYTTLFNQGRLAMTSGSTSTAQTLLEIPQLNWDVATYPVNPIAPGVGQRVTDFDLFLASTSANKDAAFQVISVVLSDEVQLDISRNGRMSALNNPAVQNEFGQAVPGFQAKHVVAFTKPKLAVMPEYRDIAPTNDANAAFNSVLYDGKDINTALREANEAINKKIQASLSK
ncbi:MAG: transporter substrate-binding protein [Paenibacillus sp.]|nr:transporter substrate-binding protein [Paenibacillus sp.]